MHLLLLLEQAEGAAGHFPGLGQFTGQPVCPLAHKCPLSTSGSSSLPLGQGPPMLGRAGSGCTDPAQTSRMSGRARVAIREGPEEQCSGNILLHFPYSKSPLKAYVTRTPCPTSSLTCLQLLSLHLTKFHPHQQTCWPLNLP